MGDGFGIEPGVFQGLAHGDVVEGRRISHEAQQLAIDVFGRIQADGSMHVRAQAQFGVFRRELDTGAPHSQGFQDFLFVVTDARNDSQTCDDYPFHESPSRNLQLT